MPDFASIPYLRWLIAAMAGIALAVWCAAILRRYVRIIIQVMENQAWMPENTNGNGDTGLWLGEEIHFHADDGHPLCGVLMRGARSRQTQPRERGVVIFAHEFGSDRSSAARYCLPLIKQGFDVFAFDFRGHGASPAQQGYHPRQWPSDRETADLTGAIRFVQQQLDAQNRPRRIALFGLSRGASSAILAASKSNDICAVISDGAYSSDTATEYFMKRFATIFARLRFIAKCHPPVFWKLLRVLVYREYARNSGCSFPSVRRAIMRMNRMPMLFIHGEKDSYIPFAQCQSLFDLAYGPKSLWIVPDARHNQCAKTNPGEYFRRIVSFLDEHLSEEIQPILALPARTRRHEAPVSVPASTLVPSLAGSQREPSATAV